MEIKLEVKREVDSWRRWLTLCRIKQHYWDRETERQKQWRQKREGIKNRKKEQNIKANAKFPLAHHTGRVWIIACQQIVNLSLQQLILISSRRYIVIECAACWILQWDVWWSGTAWERESRLYSPLRSHVHFCSATTWQQWHWPCALKDWSQWPQTEAGVYLMYWACRAMYFENKEGSQHTETLIFCCYTVLGCSKGINTTEQYKISQVSLW